MVRISILTIALTLTTAITTASVTRAMPRLSLQAVENTLSVRTACGAVASKLPDAASPTRPCVTIAGVPPDYEWSMGAALDFGGVRPRSSKHLSRNQYDETI